MIERNKKRNEREEDKGKEGREGMEAQEGSQRAIRLIEAHCGMRPFAFGGVLRTRTAGNSGEPAAGTLPLT